MNIPNAKDIREFTDLQNEKLKSLRIEMLTKEIVNHIENASEEGEYSITLNVKVNPDKEVIEEFKNAGYKLEVEWIPASGVFELTLKW